MGIFRRKKAQSEPGAQQVQDEALDGVDETNDADTSAADEQGRGPWDVTERPDLEGRMDFGALRVPGVDGMKIRLQADQQGNLGGLTLDLHRTSLQLNVFAAPRHDGVWDEVRDELAAKLTRDGGVADEKQGPFGTELFAQTPVKLPQSGKQALAPARFIGVDGPRWFIRAVITGKGATDEQAAKELEDVLANVVVDRGTQARPPREVLALTPPNVAVKPKEADEAKEEDFNPLERGPEITEIR
ncbi:Protein of unknown function [Micrococcales bacterium KH10]|nr:Protein of unknown function [Micrococcales bacterium KH10]